MIAGRATEAFIMPLASQSLHVLSNDWLLALLALRSLAFSTFRLAVQAPSITILLDMGHSLLERITTFGAEEVSIMPMLTEGNCVLANDGCLAVLAFGCEVLMEVKMAVVALSLVSIFGHSLTLDLFKWLSAGTTLDTVDTFSARCGWFRVNFERFQSCSAAEADKAFWMEVLGSSTQFYNTSLDG